MPASPAWRNTRRRWPCASSQRHGLAQGCVRSPRDIFRPLPAPTRLGARRVPDPIMNAQATSVRRPAQAVAAHELGDFTADRRVLVLMAMAVVAGVGGAAGAWVLLKLIAAASNLVWHGVLTTRTFTFAGVRPSVWMLFAPAIGGLIIGLMARYGSEKI